MPEYIPWEVARDLAEYHGLAQVIIVCWDRGRTHVVTYGESVEDSDQAAQGGDFVKRALGWTEDTCNILPSRVEQFKERAELAEAELERLRRVVRMSTGRT